MTSTFRVYNGNGLRVLLLPDGSLVQFVLVNWREGPILDSEYPEYDGVRMTDLNGIVSVARRRVSLE